MHRRGRKVDAAIHAQRLERRCVVEALPTIVLAILPQICVYHDGLGGFDRRLRSERRHAA
jgi:hypothetical protein